MKHIFFNTLILSSLAFPTWSMKNEEEEEKITAKINNPQVSIEVLGNIVSYLDLEKDKKTVMKLRETSVGFLSLMPTYLTHKEIKNYVEKNKRSLNMKRVLGEGRYVPYKVMPVELIIKNINSPYSHDEEKTKLIANFFTKEKLPRITKSLTLIDGCFSSGYAHLYLVKNQIFNYFTKVMPKGSRLKIIKGDGLRESNYTELLEKNPESSGEFKDLTNFYSYIPSTPSATFSVTKKRN